MINLDKYKGHTPADEWRMVFSKGAWTPSGFQHKQMDGFNIKVHDLRQMQVCDYEDYLVAQANQDLARDAPLLLEEVKRLREENDLLRSMQRDGIEASAHALRLSSAHDHLLEELKRMNRFAHCAMNFMSKHDLHFQFLNEHGVFTAPDGGSISMFIPYSYKWDDETKVSSEPIQFTVRGEEE